MVMPSRSHPGTGARRHGLGLLVFLLLGVVTAMAYLVVVANWLGAGGDGFGLAAAIIAMPVWSLGFGVFLWLPLWLIHDRLWGAMSGARALLISFAGGLLLVLFFVGPGGFTLRGGAILMNYFVMPMLVLGAWSHNAIMRRGSRGDSRGPAGAASFR